MRDALSVQLRRAVSPLVGIVGSVDECLPTTTEPALFQAVCSVGMSERPLGVSLAHLVGIGGAGRTRAVAASAAVGEALERYAATYVPVERLVVGTARELGSIAVEPERFALFSQRQYASDGFPFAAFTSDSSVAWVEGISLPSGEPALLPAELVYLGPRLATGGLPVGLPTSSGLACAEASDDAIVHGLLELLERDAFMLVWNNRLSLPLLEPSGDESLAAWCSLFEAPGLTFNAVDLSVFHRLPTVLGIVRAPSTTPGALGVGAAAAPTLEAAWSKALAEAFSSRMAGAKLALLNDESEGGGGDTAATFEDHIRHYAAHEHVAATRFLDSSEERRSTQAISSLAGETAKERIAVLCQRIRAAGADAYAVDVTSPDVAELGLTVMRVVAPELCALEVSAATPFRGGRRLYEAAWGAGLRSRPLAEDELNPDPHPFP